MRKTNPIPGGGGWDEAGGRGPIMQNEPNLGHRRKEWGGDAQPPIRSGAGSAESGRVQNEANLGQAAGVPAANRAKRTQFRPRAREWARAGGAVMPRRRAIVQNEPNSLAVPAAPGDAEGPISLDKTGFRG
jgi:hypothetical protein